MRLVAWLTLFVLAAALVAANISFDGHRPYRGMQSESAWLLLISNVSVFSSDLAKLQSDIVYHGGVYEEVNSAEYNMFRPYNPAVLFSNATDSTVCASGKTGLNVHVHLKPVQESQVLPYIAISAKLNPQDDENWANGAYMLWRTHRVNEALEFFEQGMNRNPSNAALRIECAAIMFRIGGAANLMRATNILSSIRPQTTDPFDLRRLMDFLGACYLQLGCSNELARLKVDWSEQFPDKQFPTMLMDSTGAQR